MYETRKIVKNAFRIAKVRGEGAVRIRVPGGHLRTKHMATIQEVADHFGNGTVHLTTRQGFEIPGVQLDDLDEIKAFMAPMVSEVERECGVTIASPEAGYPSAGTRNVSACIGNRVCRFADTDTTALARKIEKAIYPNDYHLKVAVTGCPNDCIKAHLNDIGIVATVTPRYNSERCIVCEACMDNCRARVTNALWIEGSEVLRDDACCLKCGECILQCPTGAQSRGEVLYRVLLGGRTGKKNPRLANSFLRDASEAVLLAFCRNVYGFIQRHINQRLRKEHLGYIIDRAGKETFAREVLEGVELNPEAVVVETENPGYVYPVRKP